MTYYHRRLPHWQPPGQDIFITWRLHGSFPAHLSPPVKTESAGKTFVYYDRFLDQARTGPLWLKEPLIAETVPAALRDAQSRKMFTRRAYTLMANHVHVLLSLQSPLEQVTQAIKGASARAANLILARTGEQFWQKESFDHWVRNPGEWQKIHKYIEQNTVAAGLVKDPQDWPWSSASNPLK